MPRWTSSSPIVARARACGGYAPRPGWSSSRPLPIMAGMRARLYNFDGWQRMVLCTIVSVWYPHDMLESNGVRGHFREVG
ncbi:hypothetical protein KL86PLE_60410 [uncultured Pleomorphomonas sp.]|uniref:Uncharacterized protein n=1 Tax=uncultured Pleomorphomonas sp. TaxID=442121 RepID=A0A212LKN8_9HYPH|nr:hypothetical protein KL86PLE_60410 [uncultured Pleomorphomonas sp.]